MASLQTPTAHRTWPATAVVILLPTLLTAACGTSPDPDAEPATSDLSTATIVVTSKDFTEQLLLGEIAVHALETAGAEVVNRVGLSGSQNVRDLLLDGQVDLYWEYTGTAWTTYLDRTERFATPDEQYEQLAAIDLQDNGIQWLAPAPYSNSYAIATTGETSRLHDVETLSDLARLVRQDPTTVDLCVAEEFQTRPDGLPGLQRHYGFEVDADRVHAVEIHELDRAVERQDPCNFGEVFTTSAALGLRDLTILTDDQQFFAHYQPAVVVRAETAGRHPGLADLFARLAPHLTQDTIIDLNGQVDNEGRRPAQVAAEWVDAILGSDRRVP